MNNGTTTLWRWEQDGRGGEHGALTLWPGTADEVTLTVADFRTAKALSDAAERRIASAYMAGRESIRREIARMAP